MVIDEVHTVCGFGIVLEFLHEVLGDARGVFFSFCDFVHDFVEGPSVCHIECSFVEVCCFPFG